MGSLHLLFNWCKYIDFFNFSKETYFFSFKVIVKIQIVKDKKINIELYLILFCPILLRKFKKVDYKKHTKSTFLLL